ncbi:p-nitrophenyl phosphatase [Pestalotiopsis sp. IQ-011]
MACRSCRRALLRDLSSRPSLANAFGADIQYTAARQLSRQIITTAAPQQQPQQQQQRRGFRSTAPALEEKKSWIPESVRNLGGMIIRSTSEPYMVHAATESVYKTCAAEAAYTISEEDKRNGTVKTTEEGEEIGTGSTTWHTDFDLPPTFSTWSQVTMLHMYVVYARLRNQPLDAARSWQKQLTDHFFFDAEERMDLVHGITSRGLRHRYLKDLFIQWRGVIAAYDEGLAKGDAVLAAAVWRNVYKAREDVDPRKLAAIVSWMRACLRSLDQTPDFALFRGGARTAFAVAAKNELRLVDVPARELEGVLPPSAAETAQAQSQPRVVKEAV